MADAPAVDWREGRTTNADQLSYLLENSVGSDCTFLAGEPRQEFRAHKLMLLKASSVFEAMFFGAMKETGKVEITDIQADIFEHLLRFVYTDKIRDDLSVEDLTALCLAADKYLMFNLREACIKQLCTRVDVKNVWSMLQVADLLRKDKLYEAAMKLIFENAQTILASNNIVNLSHAILLAIVQQETLNVKSEMDVVNACLRWAKQECERQGLVSEDGNVRKVLGDDIISHLRFLTLSPGDFAVGPGAADWLTSQEKICILLCLNAPSKFKVLDGLCSKLKPRAQNVYSVVEHIPYYLYTYCFQLPRKNQKFSVFGLEFIKLNIQFNSDVWLKQFKVYSQTNDPKIINEHPNVKHFRGNTYLEDIGISIGRYGYPCSGIHGGTFSFQGEVAYKSIITLTCDHVVKLSKDGLYVITIIRKVRGCYPLCDELSDECIFRDGKVEMLLMCNPDSRKCPLHGIFFDTC